MINSHRFMGSCVGILMVVTGCPLVVWGAPSYEQASWLYALRRYPEARAAFLEYATANPTAPDRERAQLYAVRSLYELKDYDGFTSAAGVLLQANPGHSAADDLEFLMCRVLQNEGRYEEAKAAFEAFQSTYPTSPLTGEASREAAECDSWLAPALDVNPTTGRVDVEEQDTYRDYLVRLYDSEQYASFLRGCAPFVSRCPENTSVPDLLLLQARALRKERDWAGVRAKANEILAEYPGSAVTALLGGVDGRTEDEAASAYAAGVTAFQAGDYAEALEKFKDFLEGYPGNWRVPEARYHHCASLYRMDAFTSFTAESARFLSENIHPARNARVRCLQAGMLVKTGAYGEAREVIEQALPEAKDVDVRYELLDLRFESWYFPGDFAKVAEEADRLIGAAEPCSYDWMLATMWRGISRANLTPPEYGVAAQAFESVMACPGPFSHIKGEYERGKAVFWRIWLAAKQDDVETARSYVKMAQERMPECATKRQILERFGSYSE